MRRSSPAFPFPSLKKREGAGGFTVSEVRCPMELGLSSPALRLRVREGEAKPRGRPSSYPSVGGSIFKEAGSRDLSTTALAANRSATLFWVRGMCSTEHR